MHYRLFNSSTELRIQSSKLIHSLSQWFYMSLISSFQFAKYYFSIGQKRQRNILKITYKTFSLCYNFNDGGLVGEVLQQLKPTLVSKTYNFNYKEIMIPPENVYPVFESAL